MQKIRIYHCNREQDVLLPQSSIEVVPGVEWGHHYCFGSPSYWYLMANYASLAGIHSNHRLGETLEEEITACLLGGFGMKAELGIAAFARLKEHGILDKASNKEEILRLLLIPFDIGGRPHRYRYPEQKSGYISSALGKLRNERPNISRPSLEFRDWLISFDGIGLKTASWIARNYLASDDVAILDIHILRAGKLMGIFNPLQKVEKHYREMEKSFVQMAKAMDVKTSLLDALIWDQMREMPNQILTASVAA